MVNINDFESGPAPTSWPEIVDAIFERQRELMREYKLVERLPDPPLPLATENGQRVLREFAGRVTEELAEAAEEMLKWDNRDGCFEELADGLHFLVELLIFAAVSPDLCVVEDEFPPEDLGWRDTRDQSFWRATHSLWWAMSSLRLRPWRRDAPTDVHELRSRLSMAFADYVQLMADCGMTQEDVHSYYFRKSQVNQARLSQNQEERA